MKEKWNCIRTFTKEDQKEKRWKNNAATFYYVRALRDASPAKRQP